MLQEGLLLLHCLAMQDRNFTDHHLDVEKFYLAAVTSLSKLYHRIPDVTDNESRCPRAWRSVAQQTEPQTVG